MRPPEAFLVLEYFPEVEICICLLTFIQDYEEIFNAISILVLGKEAIRLFQHFSLKPLRAGLSTSQFLRYEIAGHLLVLLGTLIDEVGE